MILKVIPEAAVYSSTKAIFATSKNDAILKMYSTPQPQIPLDMTLLMTPNFSPASAAAKLKHLEQVMLSTLCGPPTTPLILHSHQHNIQLLLSATTDTIDADRIWFKHHLRMLEFPHASIQYDLDELARHVGYTRRKREFATTRDWNMDLILSLTLMHKQDEETCRRLSLVLLKISKTDGNVVNENSVKLVGDYSPDYTSIVREIKMFVKMAGLVHLKHMLLVFFNEKV
ncbi:hypothetical protein HK100_007054 [Physocladia obscura]|uniref:Uncharacterized protein n=1 Tax=Physocladia obscura TaxID=109957 RepID=A0AAD5T5J4_9FUNG|nr:hypothetical protein HK100_007054 [Physocladia obscura]